MTLRGPTYLAKFPNGAFIVQSSSYSTITAKASAAKTTSLSPVSGSTYENVYGVFLTEVTVGTSSDTDAELVNVMSHEEIESLHALITSTIVARPTKTFNLSLNLVRLGATLYLLPEAGAAITGKITAGSVRPGAPLYPFPVVGDTPETSNKDF